MALPQDHSVSTPQPALKSGQLCPGSSQSFFQKRVPLQFLPTPHIFLEQKGMAKGGLRGPQGQGLGWVDEEKGGLLCFLALFTCWRHHG